MFKFILLLTLSIPAYADQALLETRYCGAPLRDSSGVITRRSDVLTAFKRIHPCPATTQSSGNCEGWQINHVIPLACGGCDAVSNLVWIPTDVKTCGTPHCTDRYERKISAATPPISGTAACVNVIVK
jgi:hypothetical protein